MKTEDRQAVGVEVDQGRPRVAAERARVVREDPAARVVRHLAGRRHDPSGCEALEALDPGENRGEQVRSGGLLVARVADQVDVATRTGQPAPRPDVVTSRHLQRRREPPAGYRLQFQDGQVKAVEVEPVPGELGRALPSHADHLANREAALRKRVPDFMAEMHGDPGVESSLEAALPAHAARRDGLQHVVVRHHQPFGQHPRRALIAERIRTG